VKKVFFIFIILFFVLHTAEAQNPFITNYTIVDGMPSSNVYCAYQDRNGFMWFGTEAGVVRFDGNSFQTFTNDDGLSDASVIKMKEDIEGRLWFFNWDGSINYHFNNAIYNYKNAPFLDEFKTGLNFIDFFQDKDSTLYFYNSKSEIFVVKNNELIDYAKFILDKKKPFERLSFFNKTSAGKFVLWSTSGVFELENIDGTPQQISQETLPLYVFKNSKTECVEFDQRGYIHLFKDTKIIRKNILHLETRLVNSIVIDKNNNVWISSLDEGIFCFRNDSMVLHIPIKNTQDIVLDRENNLWAVSNNDGIFKINLDILKYKFIGDNEFDGKGITDLAPSNQKGVWATNGDALFYILDQKKFPSRINVGGNIVNNIHQLKNNSIILSGPGMHLVIIDDVVVNSKKETIEFKSCKKSGLGGARMAIDSSENTLCSSLNDQLFMIELNDLSSATVKSQPGRIHNIFFNKEDKLIVNADKNYLYSDLKYRARLYERFNGQVILSHLVIDKENEILNIRGGDIYLLHQSDYYNLTGCFSSQIDSQVKDVFYYGTTLFFFTTKTVYFISNIFNVLQGNPVTLSRLNIDWNTINDIYCQNNTLFIASKDGLTFIPINECINTRIKLPESYFYKISLDDKEYDFHSKTVEFKNNKRLSIEYSSLNYSSIPSNYSYMLEGVDDDWINGSETKVVYLNLTPGKYTFKLRSRRNREEYSTPIELPIIVNPTLIQRPITKLVILLVLIFVVFIIIRGFYRQKIKKKETDHLLITLEHKALQSMMNPHFIFNALGSIQGYLLQNRSIEAGTYLSQFARLIRQNMNSLKSNSICIDDEIDRLRNYIDLEKLRMNDKFDYRIEVDEDLDSYDIYIPSMIIQPFVENAIWHGVSTVKEKGLIKIIFEYFDDKSVKILVDDNGVGICNSETDQKLKQGLNMGIELTKKRLKIIGERYNVKAGISATNLSSNSVFPGTRIKIIVPIVNKSFL
jgi:hypothetical protein